MLFNGFTVWSYRSASLFCVMDLCALSNGWEEVTRKAAAPIGCDCLGVFSIRRRWVTAAWRMWLATLSKSTIHRYLILSSNDLKDMLALAYDTSFAVVYRARIGPAKKGADQGVGGGSRTNKSDMSVKEEGKS